MEGEIVELKGQVQAAENDRQALRDEVEEFRNTVQQLTQQLAEAKTRETAAAETPRDETPRDETPRDETPHNETPHDDDTPHDETPKPTSLANETPIDESEAAAKPSEDAETGASTVDESADPGIPENRVDSQIGNNVLLSVLRDTSEESL